MESDHPSKKATEQLHLTKSERKGGKMTIMESLENGIEKGQFDHLIDKKLKIEEIKEDKTPR